MESSNNYFQMMLELRQHIDWLNQILKGGETDIITVDGTVKPSISKDIADKWAAISAMVQGRASFETKADLLASGAPPAGQLLAEVWRDSTLTNNGLYGWTGSVWEKSAYDAVAKAFENESNIDYLNNIVFHEHNANLLRGFGVFIAGNHWQ